jgi:hypothetical protein
MVLGCTYTEAISASEAAKAIQERMVPYINDVFLRQSSP